MTLGWGGSEQSPIRSRSISVRFLIKPKADKDTTLEEKQQRTNNVMWMHIASTQLRNQQRVTEDEEGDSAPLILCVASRSACFGFFRGLSKIEQFTTKLDTSGKIIAVDKSGVSPQYSQYILNKYLMNRVLRDLVPQQEVHNLNKHLRETLNDGQSTSAVYRLQVSPDKLIKVQTRSKIWETSSAVDTDCIMATHTIVG